ncbi:transcriptional regulator [Candidatus Falkowbacteria bacterium CG10_big_fil_rev_8_21_14_0_10_39_11]|uniref:Transcriptional regulator n=1 Tax=Candidatus Falkowbacteria bacterium CG10_big_fil_rev_8_21_14_0_10_39_11 TaxID=1974565 RepID=A0A2H0V3R5_9BACT|nr:MAG: transcriptional regulator [Candidatus Falkowbacteria bacterium CG10_big_fil_rev_8_21_14_0_10_39_11]
MSEQHKCYKRQVAVNLKKAAGQLNRVITMAEDEKYCIDIMQQTLAVIGLLKSANQQLLEGHLNSCFKKAMETKGDAAKQKMIDEILKVTKLSNK